MKNTSNKNNNGNASELATVQAKIAQAVQANMASDTANETVLVQFKIEPITKLAGVDAPDAPISLLNTQAALLNERAQTITKTVRDGILPLLESFEHYGQKAGKPKNVTDEAYCEAKVETTLPNGARVSIPVSTVFGETAVAMIRHLTSGGIPLAKFEEFKFNTSLLKKATPATNAGKGDEFRPVENEFGKFAFALQSVGVDTGGQLKGFYEVLAIAAKSVLIGKDELKALELIDGMKEKSGVPADKLQSVVQFIVDASVAREMRRLANTYSEKAKTTSQQRVRNFNANAQLNGRASSASLTEAAGTSELSH